MTYALDMALWALPSSDTKQMARSQMKMITFGGSQLSSPMQSLHGFDVFSAN